MKTIYLVRHGEAEGNAARFYQTATTPLTDKGRGQAQLMAERARKLPVDIIVSSTMDRAKETASIIASKMDMPIEHSGLFVERRRPSEQLGQSKDDPNVCAIDELLRANFGQSGWHYSDEENFDELKDRAGRALAFLLERPEDRMLVVGHGLFTLILIARAIFGEKLFPAECAAFLRAIHIGNTGISILHHDNRDEEGVRSPSYWKLHALNDQAHLG